MFICPETHSRKGFTCSQYKIFYLVYAHQQQQNKQSRVRLCFRQFYADIQAEQSGFSALGFSFYRCFTSIICGNLQRDRRTRSNLTSECCHSFIYNNYKNLDTIVALPVCSGSLWKYLYLVFLQS